MSLLAVLLSTLLSTSAACGGFFCSFAEPVKQSGEHILFSMKDGVVTTAIQIAYQGAAADFSWVLPIPSTPTAFDVASDNVFRALHRFTDPSFDVVVNASCAKYQQQCYQILAGNAAPRSDAAGGGEKVKVLLQGDVGPFTFLVIAAKDGDSEGAALFEWLKENKFQIPDTAMPIVTRYVKLRYRFVTLKLKKGASAGELVPIVIQYPAPSAFDMSCVPLRLTAIAAVEMPIYVWIAADSRAVAQNFLTLTPSLRQLPWHKCIGEQASSFFGLGGAFATSQPCLNEYVDLLKKTASHFGTNKWLTTEFAGALTKDMLDAIYDEKSLPFDKAALAATKTPQSFLQMAIGALPFDLRTSPVMQALLREFIPKPSDVSDNCNDDRAFYAVGGDCLDNYSGFNAAKAADAIDARLIAPMRRMRADLSKFKYLTRFYGSFAPTAMVRDPIFRLVTGLPDVSNKHQVTMSFSCDTPKFDVTFTHADGFAKVVSGAELAPCGLKFPDDASPIVVAPDDPIQAIEVLQADAGGKLVRKSVTKASIEKDDADLAPLDGMLIGSATDPSLCNLGSNGCPCAAGICATALACDQGKCRVSSDAASLAVSAVLFVAASIALL